MSEVIYLSNVRLSFPHIIEPRANDANPTGPKKFSADFIMPPTHAGFQQFMATYAQLAQAEFKEHAQQVMQMIQADRKLRCYGSGAEKINKKTFTPYDGYADQVYVSASTERQPQMIQQDGKPVDPTNTMAYQALARKMYGGCRVNAAIRPWVQKNKHGNGIRCDLVAVQFFQDDKAFGEGAIDVTPMFGAVGEPSAPAMPAFMMGQ